MHVYRALLHLYPTSSHTGIRNINDAKDNGVARGARWRARNADDCSQR